MPVCNGCLRLPVPIPRPPTFPAIDRDHTFPLHLKAIDTIKAEAGPTDDDDEGGHCIVVHDRVNNVDVADSQIVDAIEQVVDLSVDTCCVADENSRECDVDDKHCAEIDSDDDSDDDDRGLIISDASQDINEVLNGSFGEAILKQLEDSDLSYLLDECDLMCDVEHSSDAPCDELTVSIPLNVLDNKTKDDTTCTTDVDQEMNKLIDEVWCRLCSCYLVNL